MKSDPTNKSLKPLCAFCNEYATFVYKMAEYSIYQCSCCNTGFVSPMPSSETLLELYNGFISDMDKNKMLKSSTALSLFQQLGVCKNRNDLKMIDIGSGAGFFCKAFEDLGYGTATYVDLDPQSCQFAKDVLGLKNVYNVDAMNMPDLTNEKYDFIYCRHLIEHLRHPTVFLLSISSLLKKDGIFVVQFPNGESLEYLVYPHLNILYRYNKIRKTNNFSYLKTLQFILFGKMLHGMDPPRHLWAISKKGITLWAQRNKFHCEIFTRHIGDVPFSPNYPERDNFIIKLTELIGQRILAPIKGGTHIIAILRKQ